MLHCNPLNAIKMHLICHMLKSFDAIYLCTLLTNVIVEPNSVDPDQQQFILCLHCLSRGCKTFQQTIKSEDFIVISDLMIK